MHLHEEFLDRYSLSAIPLIKHTKDLYFAFIGGVLFSKRFIVRQEPPAYSFNILTPKKDCKNGPFESHDLGIVEWDAYELFVRRWVTETNPIAPTDLNDFYWRTFVSCHVSWLANFYGQKMVTISLDHKDTMKRKLARKEIVKTLKGRRRRHWEHIFTKYRDNNADWLTRYVKVWNNHSIQTY